MTNGIVVGISEEENTNRLVRKLYTLCMATNKAEMNIESFKNSIKQRVKNDITTLELLETFFDFDSVTQSEILNECCTEREEKERTGIIFDISKQNNIFDEMNAAFEMDEVRINRIIKYSKNPLEKQMLQRQLNSAKFMTSKHRHSKKKHKK